MFYCNVLVNWKGHLFCHMVVCNGFLVELLYIAFKNNLMLCCLRFISFLNVSEKTLLYTQICFLFMILISFSFDRVQLTFTKYMRWQHGEKNCNFKNDGDLFIMLLGQIIRIHEHVFFPNVSYIRRQEEDFLAWYLKSEIIVQKSIFSPA